MDSYAFAAVGALLISSAGFSITVYKEIREEHKAFSKIMKSFDGHLLSLSDKAAELAKGAKHAEAFWKTQEMILKREGSSYNILVKNYRAPEKAVDD